MSLKEKLASYISRNRRDASEEEMPLPGHCPLLNPKAHVSVFTWPFRHIVIDNAFTDEMIGLMSQHVDRLLEEKEKHFTYRDFYDLFLRTIRPERDAQFNVFFDATYKKLIETLFNTRLTHHTTVVIHNNIPREEDKYIHSDWVRVFFPDDADPGYFINSNPPGVTNNILENGNEAPAGSIIERRSVTGIAYLNRDWKKGDGGATGIFSKAGDTYIEAAEIEPQYNRLLLFENTPHSHHNYTASSLPNRNTVIQWFHTPIRKP